MATATKTPAETPKARAPKTPSVAVNFSKIEAKPADAPVVQNRGVSLDSTPVPQWLRESWAARKDGIGAPVDLPNLSEGEVTALKRLMIRAIQGGAQYGLDGVGVKFQVFDNGEGVYTLRFQTRTRKVSKPKSA